MTLGERISHLRGRRTQIAVAAAAGIDAATLNRIERGKSKNPSEDTLEAIAGALGVNVSDLTDPAARLAHGFEKREGPPPFSLLLGEGATTADDALGRALTLMRGEIHAVLNIAWEARTKAEAASAKADEALRKVARRGRRNL